MADETQHKPPKIELVNNNNEDGVHDPTNVFNDLNSLRKESKLTVRRKSVLVNVTVDKPPSNVHFRIHPDPEMRLEDATVLHDRDEGVFYYVVPAMRKHPKIERRLRRVTLALVYCWPGGNIMIWPVPFPVGRDFPAWKSDRKAYELAQTQWVQIVWNEEQGDYAIETAEDLDKKLGPAWPDKTFSEHLKIGFSDKVVDNEEHHYVRRLRGVLD
jgi:hypothetical protein